MSGKNNVNPGHYKVAGRERQGEAIVHEREKQDAALESATRPRSPANFIPGAAPVGQANSPRQTAGAGQRTEAKRMTSPTERTAARRNIRKAAAAAQRKQTPKRLPKKTRTALGKEGAKARRRKAA